jgi:hypothetical protein
MGIKIGDIDIAQEIVELNFQLRKTQKFLEILTNKLSGNNVVLTNEDLELAEQDALKFVQEKFPNLGVQRKT